MTNIFTTMFIGLNLFCWHAGSLSHQSGKKLALCFVRSPPCLHNNNSNNLIETISKRSSNHSPNDLQSCCIGKFSQCCKTLIDSITHKHHFLLYNIISGDSIQWGNEWQNGPSHDGLQFQQPQTIRPGDGRYQIHGLANVALTGICKAALPPDLLGFLRFSSHFSGLVLSCSNKAVVASMMVQTSLFGVKVRVYHHLVLDHLSYRHQFKRFVSFLLLRSLDFHEKTTRLLPWCFHPSVFREQTSPVKQFY